MWDLEIQLLPSKIYLIIDFLGYFVKQNYVLVRQRVVARLKNRLSKYSLLQSDKCDNIDVDKLKVILSMVNSYYGHFRHAFTYNLRKNICKRYLRLMQKYFLPKKDFLSLKHIKK